MIFSLFERQKPEHKVQLKNPNKVVIGSGTDLERAFQIGNFMNMLQYNIENESQSMTNSVIKHNLMVELLFKELESTKKLEKELPHLKRDVKNETKQLINLMRRTAVTKYNMVVDEIVFTFPKYFEYIK